MAGRYGKGWLKPHAPLRRDFWTHPAWRASNLGAGPTGPVDHGPSTPFIFDQGQIGSCVGHATARAGAQACALKGAPLSFVPSPDDLYRLFREMMRAAHELPPGPLTDSGTDMYFVPQTLSLWGVRPFERARSPNNTTDCTPATITRESVLSELEQDAAHLEVGVYQVFSAGAQRYSDVKTALSAGLPVVVGFNVDSAFEDWTPDRPPVGAPDPNDLLGGHGVVADGIDTEGNLIIASSWGTDWADQGRALCSPAWLEDSGVQCFVFDVGVKS